jgi:hypothetical protein
VAKSVVFDKQYLGARYWSPTDQAWRRTLTDGTTAIVYSSEPSVITYVPDAGAGLGYAFYSEVGTDG